MGKKVPISIDNIAFERLDLSRHYLTVDCDATCFLVLNPSGEIPLEGTDICALHTGAWQIDCWSLLTKKDFPNQAGFVACLVWDSSLISESVHVPQCVESDIDTANSVSSLKGQPVNIVGFSMSTGEALPVQLPPDFQAGVVSGSANPVFTRFRPLYFPSIGKNIPLGDGFEPLKAIAQEVISMANGSIKLYLRPRCCEYQSGNGPCRVFPDYMTTYSRPAAGADYVCDIVRYITNRLILTVDGQVPYTVTNIQYFLDGASEKSTAYRSFYGGDVSQLNFVEF